MMLRTCWIVLISLTLVHPVEAEVKSQKLRNGITMLLAPDARAAGVDVTVWYRAGSVYEPAGKTGLTHVLEQLMFRGSPSHPAGEHLAMLQAEGGQVGTHSTPEYSSFYQTVPPDAVGKVFELEADRMKSLTASESDLEEVRRLIRANRERSGGSAIGLGVQRLYATAFGNHPYARPAIGFDSDLDGITLEDCMRYHHDRYTPGDAVVTVVGRFDASDVMKLARGTFERVPRRKATKAAVPALNTEPSARETGTYAFASPAVFVGWRIPGRDHEDAAALDVLSRVLSRRPGSRLATALTGEGGGATFVQGGLEVRNEAGILYAFAALPSGADTAAVREVETRMLSSIESFALRGPAPEAFAGAKREAEMEQLFGAQQARGRALNLGASYMAGDGIAGADANLAALRALTSEHVQQAAKRYLTAERQSVVWMLPDAAMGGNQ